MANIINADNGAVSLIPGLKTSADASGVLQLQTNGTNALLIDASQYPFATVNGLSAGRIPAEQFYRLNSDYTGANATTAQPIFGVGVTLVGSTVYQFEFDAPMTKTSGTTAHIVSLLFGGTATINNINYTALTTSGSSSTLTTSMGINALYITTASAVAITGSGLATNPARWHAIVRGTVSVNVGGTFIPQYSCSAAPGGSWITNIGAYFKISPLGASGSNTSIGNWS